MGSQVTVTTKRSPIFELYKNHYLTVHRLPPAESFLQLLSLFTEGQLTNKLYWSLGSKVIFSVRHETVSSNAAIDE